MNHSSQILIDFSYDKDIDDDIANATGNGNTEEASATGAKEGMKKGAILGMAFAGYAAWLGPAAATITFAEVLIPWVLPLALGGAFVGSIFGSAKFDVASVENNAKKKKELIEDFYQEILKAASKEIKNIRMSLEGCTEHYYEERCERYREKARQLNFDFTEPAYSAFMQELENYISELDAAIAECAGSAVPVPPSMEGLNQ